MKQINQKSPKLEIFYIVCMLISGWITFIMTFFVEMAGGGASLIIVLTSPILIGLSVIFSLLHYWAYRRCVNDGFLFGSYVLIMAFLLVSTFKLYPYA